MEEMFNPIVIWTLGGSGVVFALAWLLKGLRLRFAARLEPVDLGGVLLLVEVPKFNEQGPVAAEMMFAALHGLLKETPLLQEHLSFEIVATEEGIKFYAFVPEKFEKFVKSQIYAQYPQAEISRVADYSLNLPAAAQVAATEVVLSREFFFPIKTFPNFEVDPLAAITSAIEDLKPGEQAWLQLLVRPLPDEWQSVGYKYVNCIKQGLPLESPSLVTDIAKKVALGFLTLFGQVLESIISPAASKAPPGAEEKEGKTPPLSAEQALEISGVEEKLTKLGFETAIRVVGIAETPEETSTQVDSMVASLKQFSTAHLNSFERSGLIKEALEVLQEYRKRSFPVQLENIFILNTEELASLFHLPNVSVETPSIAWTKAKKAEYPLDLPVEMEPIIGETAFRAHKVKFGIRNEDRRRHMYMVGKTGSGKTTLMENMIISDIKNGKGVAVLDPHGDMVTHLLDYVPEERVEDVVFFNPPDLDYPVSLNMLELFDPEQKGLVTSGLIGVFQKRFEFSWGPRLEHILRNCILTLLDIPHSTLLGVARLLTDKAYRKYCVHLVGDPIIKDFWETEYEGIMASRAFVAEVIQPIQNRLGQFLATVSIRNIVGQPESTIQLDEVMDKGKILLVNLSTGKLGTVNSAILGGMLISRLQFAAMTRASVKEEERRDFFVYVDEFQHFATTAFAEILSEARKYRLNLILGHQYLAQVPEEVRDAIFGNIGTLITFTVGQADAAILAKEFTPVFEADDLISLEKFHIYLKLMIDLTQSRPFSAKTLPYTKETAGNKETVIETSRRKYAVDRKVVEGRVERWAKKQFVPGMDDKEVEALRRRLREKGKMRKVEEPVEKEAPRLVSAETSAFAGEEETADKDDVKWVAEEGKPDHLQPKPLQLRGEIRVRE